MNVLATQGHKMIYSNEKNRMIPDVETDSFESILFSMLEMMEYNCWYSSYGWMLCSDNNELTGLI